MLVHFKSNINLHSVMEDKLNQFISNVLVELPNHDIEVLKEFYGYGYTPQEYIKDFLEREEEANEQEKDYHKMRTQWI